VVATESGEGGRECGYKGRERKRRERDRTRGRRTMTGERIFGNGKAASVGMKGGARLVVNEYGKQRDTAPTQLRLRKNARSGEAKEW
jgi:hypothetical protein